MRKLALILGVLIACDAGEKPAPPPAPAPKAVPKPKATTPQPDLEYLPADSDVVMWFDVKMLRASKLWPEYERGFAKLLLPGFTSCKIDLVPGITSVTIGVPIGAGPTTFVIRGIDRDRTRSCMLGMTHDAQPTVEIDGDMVTVTKDQSSVYVMTFVDATTMVMRHAGSKDVIGGVQQGAPLARDAAFMAALASAKSKRAGITMLTRPSSKALMDKWGAVGAHPKQVSATLHLTDHLSMQLVMVLGDAKEATTMNDMMKAQLENAQVKPMFDRLDARAQGDTVTLDLTMSETKLRNLATMTGSLSGMRFPD